MLLTSNSIWDMFPNFEAKEFRCGCGCNPTPAMSYDLINILQSIRTHFGKPVNVTSGFRCQKYNDSLQGSSKTSDHLKSMAADFYVSGLTTTLGGRGMVIEYARTLPGFKYAYCDGMKVTKDGKITKVAASWMGSSIHISVE